VTMNFLGLAILGYSWQVSGYVSVDTHSIRILVEFSRIQVSGYKYPDTPDTQVSVGITDI
jgi:hypothetical protein